MVSEQPKGGGEGREGDGRGGEVHDIDVVSISLAA